MKQRLTYRANTRTALRFLPASDDRIADFCAEHNIDLPTDYVAFLREHNGGGFLESSLNATAIGDLVVAYFYTLAESENYSIEHSISNLEGYVPKDFIPIAGDPGGNLYLLALDAEHRGQIFFWNHEIPSFSEDGKFEDFENLTKLFDSFGAFVDALQRGS